MGKIFGIIICALLGLFLAAHAFTRLNLTSWNPSAVYELYVNNQATGILSGGEENYRSSKLFTAMACVPFLLIAGVLTFELLTKKETKNWLTAIVLGGFIAFPLYGILLQYIFQGALLAALVSLLTILGFYFYLAYSKN